MPVYTDPSTGKRIRSEEPLDDSELEEAFGGDQSTWYERAGQYAKGQVEQFGGALGRLGMDLASQRAREQAIGAGAEPPDPNRTNWQRAQDVGTVAGPLVAPEMALAGTITGAGARAYGAEPETADLFNTAAQLGTGGVQMGRSAAGLGGRIAARFGGVARTMAQRGTLLTPGSPEGQTLFWTLANAARRFAPTSAERSAAESVMDALAHGTGLTYGDLDNALTSIQGLSRDSAIAGILRGARDAMTAGTPEAGALQSAYRVARLARMRIPTAVRTAAGLGGAGGAVFEARRGNYGRAAASLALAATGAGGSVGHLLAAAGPAARTAVGLSGPAMRSLGGPSEEPTDETAPEVSEAPPEVPAVQPQQRQIARAIETPHGPFGREIAAVASAVRVPAPLLHVVMQQEDASGNPNAVSNGGVARTPAYGLMQITPGTFETVRKETENLLGRAAHLMNPLDNILAGGVLWRKYLDMTKGDIQKAGALYYGSPGHPLSEHYGHAIVRRFAQELAARPAAATETPTSTVLPDYPGGEAQHAHDRAVVLGELP